MGDPVNYSITKIVYRFNDASVPPQYHRSYTITVTKNKAHVIVDSYGDVIAEATTNFPPRKMDDLVKSLEVFRIETQPHKAKTGKCTGGASQSLTIYSHEKILIDGTLHECGGQLEGNLSGDIEAFSQKLEELIPDLENLLK